MKKQIRKEKHKNVRKLTKKKGAKKGKPETIERVEYIKRIWDWE